MSCTAVQGQLGSSGPGLSLSVSVSSTLDSLTPLCYVSFARLSLSNARSACGISSVSHFLVVSTRRATDLPVSTSVRWAQPPPLLLLLLSCQLSFYSCSLHSEKIFASFFPPLLATRIHTVGYLPQAVEFSIDRRRLRCSFLGRTRKGKGREFAGMQQISCTADGRGERERESEEGKGKKRTHRYGQKHFCHRLPLFYLVLDCTILTFFLLAFVLICRR